MLQRSSFLLLVTMPLLFSCTDERTVTEQPPPYIMDPHSHARPNEAVVTHLDLDIRVDMDLRQIEGTATHTVRWTSGNVLVLDTDDHLEVLAVTSVSGDTLDHRMGKADDLGRALEIIAPGNPEQVVIHYRTSPQAKALQWLEPRQTEGGAQPFLFTQGQAILTRSWIPLQDSPGIRITYNARVKVPPGLMAVMSATNPQERSEDGVYSFRMDKPIPGYLMALAVGDLDFAPLGDRCGVYAEPTMLERAAWEFADTEDMLKAAEGLYGEYRWGRYDILVLPPSFPFGGMENPMLTFATPTIIAGDRSLTALVAHEMAHSWSGNLVTNATWDDFWLNEGFTVYFENRICEAVYGEDYARMHHLLGHQDLAATIERLLAKGRPEDTHLRLHLAGRDPDEGMTDIAYEKGFALLKLIESKVGRDRFDAFLRDYFDRFAFGSITTDGFLAYLKEQLLVPAGVELDLSEWVDGPGLPSNAVVPVSDRFLKVEEAVAAWEAGTPAKDLPVDSWTTHEWLHFLRNLPKDLGPERMAELDDAFGLTATGNAEKLAVWLDLSIANDHTVAFDRLREFLTTVGRRKFLVPLYTRLLDTERGRVMAQTIYAQARPNYHAVSVRTIDELLDWKATGSPVLF